MDLLSEYFEFVFPLEDWLEIILNKKLIDELNLRDLFNDVICVSDDYSISQFFNKKMSESNFEYDQFLNKIEQEIRKKNLNDFVFNRQWFNDVRFNYLYHLIGDQYFLLLIKNLNFYSSDERNNFFVQLGRPIPNEELPIDQKRFQLDLSKINLKSNHQHCIKMHESNAYSTKLIKLKQSTNKLNMINELNNLNSFLDNNCKDLIGFLKYRAKNQQLSSLVKGSPKVYIYNQTFTDNILDRNRIYENQKINESRTRFIHQFDNLKVDNLINLIFKDDSETKKILSSDNRSYLQLYKYLEHFMNKHKSLDMDDLLTKTCTTKLITDDFDNYSPTNDLKDFVKQELVASYFKKVLIHCLDQSFFGRENTERFLPVFFNLIIYQACDIDIYLSNYFFYCVLKETDWISSDGSRWFFKLKCLNYLLSWLGDYVLDLLACSFFIVKNKRLKFYRYDYWFKIMNNQLNSWLHNKLIEYSSISDQNDLDYFDFGMVVKPNSVHLQIHSIIKNDPKVENLLHATDLILKTLCQSIRMYKSKIDFFNQVKSYSSKYLKANETLYGFKIDFKDQTPHIIHDKLNDILIKKLKEFYSKNKLKKIEIRKVIVHRKIKEIKKEEIYYVHFDDKSLLENLNLAGHSDLNNCVIEIDSNTRMSYDLEFVYQIASKFIKRSRIQINEKDCIILQEGLSMNKYLTKYLLILYVNDLIETSLPQLINESNSLSICDSDKLIILSDNQLNARQYFISLIQNLDQYNLAIEIDKSFISFQMDGLNNYNLCKGCYFNNFHFNFTSSYFIKYDLSTFECRNVKSTFSFHLFENQNKFKSRLIEIFLNSFQFFELDESFYNFEEIVYTLFRHFCFFSAQIIYFFDNSIALSKDENPRLLFEIIFEFIHNFVNQMYYISELIPEFKSTLNIYTIIYILIESMIISWNLKAISRKNEFDLLKKVKNWNSFHFTRYELDDFDFQDAYKKIFKNFDFSIKVTKFNSF